MMNQYCFKLLCAINEYDGSSTKTDEIRKLICYISESANIEKTNDIRELLFEASEVIRVFGYNKLNNLNASKLLSTNDYGLIKSRLIHDYYRAKSDDKAFLDKKQKEILDSYHYAQIKRIFVSAPTSFGKTHILKEILFANYDRYKKIVLIFPTIALLTENMDSISEFVSRHNLNYKVINSFQEDETEDERIIYILTPERAIMIFDMAPKIHIDFFFFDEIYKIDEDFNSSDDYDEDSVPLLYVATDKGMLKYSRAVAFRLVLYFLAKNTDEFYLAGPYINLSNVCAGMDKFLKKFNVLPIQIDTEATLKTFYKAWNKCVISENDIEGEKVLQLTGKFSETKDKIKTICEHIESSNWGQTLVYCNKPNYAITYASYIAKKNETDNVDLKIFIEHLKLRYSVNMQGNKNSAEEWSLIKLLKGEVGVHHGKLPKYIQKEMLRLFNDGCFSVLFCTSTLIEGVNTEAKNIIVASSRIRSNNMLNQFDIKNIIGRAGRYYHHFLGRVFFIEEEQDVILNSEPQKLNFPLFDNAALSYEDLDNIDINDLTQEMQPLKLEREKLFNRNLLPDSVFVQNRLFDRLKQEKLLQIILDNFANFRSICRSAYAAELLSDEKIKFILRSFCIADIINDSQENGYFWIIKNYINNGTLGLINYEINYNKRFKSVDSGYSIAFDKVKTVIEYQMPKYITLLQALYNYACTLNNSEDYQVDLTNLTRFFETGVESTTCQYLVEHGMPVGIIRTIERRTKQIKSLPIEEGIAYLSENKAYLTRFMDSYETKIFNKLVP